MSILRERMIQDMQLRGFSPRTQQSYSRAVRKLAQHYHKSPDLVTEDDLHPQDPQTAGTTVMHTFLVNPSHRPATAGLARRAMATNYSRQAPETLVPLRPTDALPTRRSAPDTPRSHPLRKTLSAFDPPSGSRGAGLHYPGISAGLRTKVHADATSPPTGTIRGDRLLRIEEPPGADPHAGWCGERGLITPGYPIGPSIDTRI